jgi:hypothetical protein
MNTEQQWREVMRKDIATCERILTTQGSLPPTFLVHCPGIIHVIGVNMSSARARSRMITLIRTFCIAKEATSLSYLTEAWVATIERNDQATIDKADRDGVRSLPDRIEAVIAMTEYRRDDAPLGRLMQCHPIERNDRNQVTGIGLDMFANDGAGETTGRMANNFLLPKAPTPEMVAVARAALEDFEAELQRIDPN